VFLLKILAKQGIIAESENYKVLIEFREEGKCERLFYIPVRMAIG
jgi:hypothetical protein